MGKKTRRNTAKTGDKSLYKQRSEQSSKSIKVGNDFDDDDDAMYNKVDRFYNQQDEEDYLQLTGAPHADDDDDEILQQEAVLDLGGGGVSEEEADDEDDHDVDDDDDNSNEEEETEPLNVEATTALLSSDEGDDDDDEEADDVRNWGTKKSVYYHGDTADLEIGQEQEDAFIEEEAARAVHLARMKDLSEQDFVLSDNESTGERSVEKKMGNNKSQLSGLSTSARTVKMSHGAGGVALLHHKRDTSKWSVKEQRTFLQQYHPEFLPLVNHFTDVIQDFEQRTNVVVQALYEDDKPPDKISTAQEVGATLEGERYLLSRALLQCSAALNLTVYLMLKAEYAASTTNATNGGSAMVGNESIMSCHPVLDHLQKLHRFAEAMEGAVDSTSLLAQNKKSPSLNQQINHLVKASKLLESGQIYEDDEDEDGGSEGTAEELDKDVNTSLQTKRPPAEGILNENDSDDDESDSDDEQLVKAKQEAALMNEARFALRLDELGRQEDVERVGDEERDQAPSRTRRSRRAAPDFGEDEDISAAPARGVGAGKSATRSLASTVNALEQRFATSLQKRNKKIPGASDQLDALQGDGDDDDDENQIRRGLELMEAEMGKSEDEDEEDNDDDGNMGNKDDVEDDDLKFYHAAAQVSQGRKRQRKERYAVAPKFPRLGEQVEDGAERPISRTIMKNRGLVAHKNKLNRNPRVKHREKFRRAEIRRKGAVRALRDPREGQSYGGEETGIKSGLTRSRKLT